LHLLLNPDSYLNLLKQRRIILAFDKIEKQSVSDAMFYALRQKIISRCFQVGEKLPSESSLCEQFGVSKTSIKLALQRLGGNPWAYRNTGWTGKLCP
jgi:DNA-binding FadR family transcriptional regulator